MEVAQINILELNDKVNQIEENLDRKAFCSLSKNKAYIIKKLSLLNTIFGKCILAILYDEAEKCTFKTFLPKRVTEYINSDSIHQINSSAVTYTLTYLGQSTSSIAGVKSRALLKFGLL